MKRYLDKLAKDPRVSFISDERDGTIDGKIWVNLVAGWIDPDLEVPCVTGRTVAEVRAGMKSIIQRDPF